MFDVHQRVLDEYGVHDEAKVGAYIDGVMEEFAASPEAKPLLDSGQRLGWAAHLMEYGLNYPGVTPPRMSLADFNEVVFTLFPRKVSTEPESAPEIVNELRAFWEFLQRQYGLRNAGKILAELDDAAVVRLRAKLADPRNFGMAKSFVMRGMQAGFDMTTTEGTQQFMQLYNTQLANDPSAAPLPIGASDFPDPGLSLSGLSGKERAEKRKARKRQRQARKRNRK